MSADGSGVPWVPAVSLSRPCGRGGRGDVVLGQEDGSTRDQITDSERSGQKGSTRTRRARLLVGPSGYKEALLGTRDPQRGLFDSAARFAVDLDRLGFYGHLAREGHRIFRDSDFASCYSEIRRPSAPPSRLALARLEVDPIIWTNPSVVQGGVCSSFVASSSVVSSLSR